MLSAAQVRELRVVRRVLGKKNISYAELLEAERLSIIHSSGTKTSL